MVTKSKNNKVSSWGDEVGVETSTLYGSLERRISAFPQRLAQTIGQRSIRSFANEAGLSEGTLRKYLRNESYPTLDRLVGIVAAGGVCFSWLVIGEGPMRPLSASEPEGGSGDEGVG